MFIDYLHHDSTTAAVTECGSVSCADCQLSRKTNAGWYCARLQRVVNLNGCIYFSRKVATKPKTNADRIRAMTDEELSIALCRGGCPPTAWDEYGVLDCPKPNEEVCEEVCGSCWLDWLKQEAKDE